MTPEEVLSNFQNKDDDSEHRMPSQDAAQYAAILISASAAYVPEPVFLTSGNGGLEVQWKKGGRMVRLSVPRDPEGGKPYIAHDEVDYDVSPEKLCHYLSQLNGQN